MKFIGVIWGISGVTALLVCAIYRLFPKALNAVQSDLTIFQWIVLIVFALFMMVAEGYRGFQKKFSPRTASRVRHLRDNPTPLHVILAPFFCMGYFHAKRKTQLTAIILSLGILILVISMQFCPEPWRGIIDVGVVLGLSWGSISFLSYCFLALTKQTFPHSAEVPELEQA